MYKNTSDNWKTVKNKKMVLVFSGYNQRAIIAFLRTLKKNNVPFAIIAKSEDDDILLTAYKNEVIAVRNCISLDLDEILQIIDNLHFKLHFSQYMICPSTEALNRFLLKHREQFYKRNCIIPLVDESLYELISDKYSFGEICKEQGILVPTELNIDGNFDYPIVSKPREYFSKEKLDIFTPVIINNNKELQEFLEIYDIQDFYFQKFIKGRSFYLLYYFHRDGSIFKFSQENLVQQPSGKSMVVAISSHLHKTNESKKYEELFKKVNFYGLVMIEVKQEGDQYYMIEANPRLWGPSQLFVDSNINFFEALLQDYGLIETVNEFKEPSRPGKYLWYGGFVQNQFDQNVYYSSSKDYWKEEILKWIEIDIYKRLDTNAIFEKELQK